MHPPVVRAAERRVRSRRHPRVLVGQIPELAPLPSIQRLAERQAVDDVGDVRSFRVLRLVRLMRRDVEIPGHAIHQNVARDAAARVVIVPMVSPHILFRRVVLVHRLELELRREELRHRYDGPVAAIRPLVHRPAVTVQP